MNVDVDMAMAEADRELFAAVFGTDSEDEHVNLEGNVDADVDESSDEEPAVSSEQDSQRLKMRPGGDNSNQLWRPVDHVKGLWHCASFLEPSAQASLMAAIEGEGWFTQAIHNQAMRFGELPAWASLTSASISASISAFYEAIGAADTQLGFEAPLPAKLLRRQPLFDQMIVNSYQPGEGIAPHVDLARFEDGIAVLSLLSSCVMRFRKCVEPAQMAELLLLPGDLIMLSGDARYNWTHEINRAATEQVWAGKLLKQEQRISVTLRRLRPHDQCHNTQN